MIAGATRAGADLALMVLAFLAGWQLRRYSAVRRRERRRPAIDPVLALAPALALAGGTVLTLRLLPVARPGGRPAGGRAAAADRGAGRLAVQPPAAAPGRCRAAAGDGGRHRNAGAGAARELDPVGRRPGGVRQLARTSGWTWPTRCPRAGTRSAGARRRVAMAAAADPAGAARRGPGRRLRQGAGRSSGSVPTSRACPPAALFARHRAGAPTGGIARPRLAARVELTATLSRAHSGRSPLFTVTVADRRRLPAQASGTLPADGRPHALTAPLGGDRGRLPAAARPGPLSYTMPPKPLRTPVTLTVAGADAQQLERRRQLGRAVSQGGNLHVPLSRPRRRPPAGSPRPAARR